MGFQLTKAGMDSLLQQWSATYDIYAPKVFAGGGRFSDTDCIRYGKINTAAEIVWDKKSLYSFKEVLMPISQTLFYFMENECKEADGPKKGAIVFLRSCDLHAVQRLDDMYLNNGPTDYYYARIRDRIKFVLMGCSSSFENCFCVSMGSNESDNYNLAVNVTADGYTVDCKDKTWTEMVKSAATAEQDVVPDHVTENAITVTIPKNLSIKVNDSTMWNEYDSRCINCGRCNFVCPTCTCFTMQDLFYSENGNAGERRRVWASCMVDGYTDMAGGVTYRDKNGQRMRFKVLHKVLDYRQRNGYDMCVGCGRCDDVCPEYISFSHCINKLGKAMEEVSK
jgi:anaerobic sulfite reductase subunit A